MSRGLLILALAVAVSGCGGATARGGQKTISISEEAMKTRIAALADCPSPLTRLGMKRIQPQVQAFEGGTVDLVIPSSEDDEGSRIHFQLRPTRDSSPPDLTVSWNVDLSDKATELDLGEERLLNPTRVKAELVEAVDQYLTYYYQVGSSAGYSFDRSLLKTSCRKIGRLIDDVAVTTNPALARQVAGQKGREAIGWLFVDNLRLGRESPDFDSGSGYDPGWED